MKKLFTLACATIFAFTATAQKLPDLQNKEVKPPAAVRVDGKDTEWNGEYAAYNKKLDVYYTLSNDAKNLYLVLKSKFDGKDLNKILAAGVRLAINLDNKKSVENTFNVSFPIRSAAGGQGGAATVTQTVVVSDGVLLTGSRAINTRNLDSMMLANRTSQLEKAKEIKVFGFPAIQDSLISIYNEHNIKAAAKFNTEKEYIYELAIPLSLMGIDATKAREVTYQLRTNPFVRLASAMPANVTIQGGGGTFQLATGSGMGGFNEMLIPNEVWGKYNIVQY